MSAPDHAEPFPVFFNLQAGTRATRKLAAVEAAFRRAGLRVELRPTAPGRLANVVRRAAEQGAAAVAVSGGDGTVASAASVLVGTPVALLPIPTGTFNHFARRFGILRIEDAARAVVDGERLSAPVAFVNGHAFLNTATCGVYSPIVRRRDRIRRWTGKWVATALAAVPTALRFPVFRFELEIGGATLRRETPLAWATLGAGGFPAAHRARPGSRELELVLARRATRTGLVAFSAVTLVATVWGEPPRQGRLFERFTAPRFVLRAPQRIGLTLDGEAVELDSPLEFSVARGALPVLAPRERFVPGDREQPWRGRTG